MPADRTCEVLVIGAGVVGLTAAARLALAGRRVLVLDAAGPGAGTTGRSTGKATLLQGVRLSEVRDRNSTEVAAAYLEACRAGAAWIGDLDAERAEDWELAPAYTLAASEDGAETLEQEYVLARELGLAVERADPAEAPFPVRAAIRLDRQAMGDPMALARRLAALARSAGATVVTGCRVVEVDPDHDWVRVETEQGELQAEQVVVATGTPIVDRGGHFARLRASRSRVAAFRVPSRRVTGMHLCIDAEPRSLRPARKYGVEYVVAAGSAADVGRVRSTAEHAEQLRRNVQALFPDAEPVFEWAAQDYQSLDAAPYAGAVDGAERLHVITGFGKWGLAPGAGAALAVADDILDRRPEWADRLFGRRITVSDATTAVAWNAEVAARLVGGLARATVGSGRHPAEGEGHVEFVGAHPTGISRVDGTTRRVSAVCTHLGGVLTWNDAECSWDCPLHGSRFAPDGRRLEGPARHDLERRDLEHGDREGDDPGLGDE